MSDGEPREIIENLTSRLRALEAAVAAMDAGDSDAVEMFGRAAQSFAVLQDIRCCPEILVAARRLAESSADSFQDGYEEIRGLITKIIDESTAVPSAILVVEDDQVTRLMVKSILVAQHLKTFEAANAAEAEAILRREEIDLVVLDLILPDQDGRNLLLQWREQAVTARLPVVVLSGRTGSATRAECAALGANVFIEKPFDPSVFTATVLAELQRAAAARRESRYDALTKLPNRTALAESYVRALALSTRAGEPFSVAILDLDRFKSVNDTYGHDAGDEVLRRAARVLRETLRKSDVLGRWGGEEFVVFFPSTSTDGARRGLEKALDAMRAETFTIGRAAFQVTFSAGVHGAPHDSSLEQAIASADALLYKAKDAGRNRIVTPDEEITSAPIRIVIVEDDPVTAKVVTHRLEREQFRVDHFADGAEAATALPDIDASVIVLDIQLPGKNGFEILRSLRASRRHRSTPVLMLTTLGHENDVVRGFETGADDYMTKPFSPVELIGRIRRMLARKK